GYEDKGLNTGLNGSLAGIPRAYDIVVNPLDHVVLHDRHMLVRRSVINGLNRPRLHDLKDPMPVKHTSQQWNYFHLLTVPGSGLPQLRVNRVEREFRHFEQYEPTRRQLQNLPAKLGTY